MRGRRWCLRQPPVALEFWPTRCTISEQIQPDILSLGSRYGPAGTSFAIAREREADPVRTHLANHLEAGAASVLEAWLRQLVR